MTNAAPPKSAGEKLLVEGIATFFGSGHFPIWPGTAGTLAAVPLAYVLTGLGWPWLHVVTAMLCVVGIWAADRYGALTGTHDNRRIVIDEVVGYLLSLWVVPRTLPNLAVGFLLFRIFDAWKPGPIRIVDRRAKGGFGVMADDVCAGVLTGAILWFLQPYFSSLIARAPWLRLG